jgi:hypothetical protein
MTDSSSQPYHLAQRAIADLKTAVLATIRKGPPDGMANVEIGRTLGIYTGHEGHEGHIPRTILAMLEDEGVIEQDEKSKRWSPVDHGR